MVVTKFLEKKSVIRVFGIGLLVAPLVSSYFSLMYMSHFSNKVTLDMYWKVLFGGSLTEKTLVLLGGFLAIGMLSGSGKMWAGVLIYLGCHLADQVLHLGTNLKLNWIYGLFFLINLGLFLFIADQLVWKQKPLSAKKSPPSEKMPIFESLGSSPPAPQVHPAPSFNVAVSAPTPVAPPLSSSDEGISLSVVPIPQLKNIRRHKKAVRTSTKNIIIHFQGLGPWARLIEITSNGLMLRSLKEPPRFADHRPIEIALAPHLRLKTTFKRQHHNDYFFEFENLDPATVRALNSWILQKAS